VHVPVIVVLTVVSEACVCVTCKFMCQSLNTLVVVLACTNMKLRHADRDVYMYIAQYYNCVHVLSEHFIPFYYGHIVSAA
jgi:hypothetical protein